MTAQSWWGLAMLPLGALALAVTIFVPWSILAWIGERHTEFFATQEEAVSWLKAKRDELYGEFGGRLINPQGGPVDHRN